MNTEQIVAVLEQVDSQLDRICAGDAAIARDTTAARRAIRRALARARRVALGDARVRAKSGPVAAERAVTTQFAVLPCGTHVWRRDVPPSGTSLPPDIATVVAETLAADVDSHAAYDEATGKLVVFRVRRRACKNRLAAVGLVRCRTQGVGVTWDWRRPEGQ